MTILDHSDEWINLTDLSPDDHKFDKHKAQALEIARLYGLESKEGYVGFVSGNTFVSFEKYSFKIEKCGSWLVFQRDSENRLHLTDAKFCKHPNCPMCQWRRASKWRAKFFKMLPEIVQNYPTHRFAFLTLTIRNCELDDLRGTLTHLNDAYNRLSKNVRFPFVGAVKSIEVTRAWDCYFEGEYLGRHGTRWVDKWEFKSRETLELVPTTEVHPHIHVLGMVQASYFVRGYISQEDWTEMWKKALRADYKPIVHIKAVKSKKGKDYILTSEEFEADPTAKTAFPIAALCETFKYTVKEQDLLGTRCNNNEVNSHWLKLLTEQLYKKRRVEYRGVFKEIGKQIESELENEDLIKINNEDEESKDIIDEISFKWENAIRKYVSINSYLDYLPNEEYSDNLNQDKTILNSLPY